MKKGPKEGKKHFKQRQGTSKQPQFCQKDRTVAPTKEEHTEKNRYKLNHNNNNYV